MKNTTKYIFLSALMFGLFVTARAQDYNRHEFSVHAGGGLSTMQYSISGGEYTIGYGGNAGLGYNYFFHRNWSLGTGVELGLYNAKCTTPAITGSYEAFDAVSNENFQFDYNYRTVEEKQTAYMVTIPVLLNFQTRGAIPFYASAGFRIGIPVSATFDQAAKSMYTAGLYAEGAYFNQGGSDGNDYAAQGFVTNQNYNATGDIELNVNVMLSVEVGTKWTLNEKLSLYTGLYCDYGLNDMRKTTGTPLVTYNSNQPSVLSAGSMLNTTASGTVHSLAAGLRVSLAFGK